MGSHLQLALAAMVSCALGAASARAADERTADESAAPASPQNAETRLARQLQLAVNAEGPGRPWQLVISNLGPEPVAVAADLGLLELEVSGGRQKPTTCRLPSPLRPKVVRRRSVRVIPPGESLARGFDPRFYCFAELTQKLLVPGARVTPHLGWAHETKTTWRRGKRLVERLPPRPPFVAWIPEPSAVEAASPDGEPGDAEPLSAEPPALQSDDIEPGDSEAGDSEPGDSEPAGSARVTFDQPGPVPLAPPEDGLKRLDGPAVDLGPEYAPWSQIPADDPSPEGLSLRMSAGADANSEREATAQVTITNHAGNSVALVLRRELLTFQVQGPEGPFECESSIIARPTRSGFSSLSPKRSRRITTRLIEVCPRGRLSRPGLYVVTASYESRYDGERHGLGAFTGKLIAPRPALVRVRTGQRPYARRVGAAPAGSGGGESTSGESFPEAPQVPEMPEHPMEEAPTENLGSDPGPGEALD